MAVGSGGQRSSGETRTCSVTSGRAERERTREMHSGTAGGTKDSVQVHDLEAAGPGSLAVLCLIRVQLGADR